MEPRTRAHEEHHLHRQQLFDRPPQLRVATLPVQERRPRRMWQLQGCPEESIHGLPVARNIPGNHTAPTVERERRILQPPLDDSPAETDCPWNKEPRINF